MLAGQPPTSELMQMVQGLKQKGIATRKACEDYADSITETKIGAALIIGIARAEADLEIMEESLAALGGGGDRTTEEKLKVADKLQASPNLLGCRGDMWIIFSTDSRILCYILLNKTLFWYITLQKSCYYSYWLFYMASCVILILYNYLYCNLQDNT